MPVTMRAKMVVTNVNRSGYVNGHDPVTGKETVTKSDAIKMAAVAAKTYPPDGSDEDNTFARFSPSGTLELTIANPALIGVIEPGTKFYIDFTEAEQ